MGFDIAVFKRPDKGYAGKDGIVKNEKMGCQDLYTEISKCLCSDGDTNDISSRGRNAGSQYADDNEDKEQGCQYSIYTLS